jgi:transcriptional regulator with XRE-family HTH domain
MNYRYRNRISQSELCERVGISRNYLSMIERGQAQNLSIEILVSLAKAMGARPDYLLNVLLEQSG